MYKNSEILSAVLVEWIKPNISMIVADLTKSQSNIQSANSWIKKYFPVGQDYSIVNDFAFLLQPMAEMSVRPMLLMAMNKAGITEEMLPDYVNKIADELVREANEKGQVSIFNKYNLEKQDVERLKELLDKNLPMSQESYKVIQ